MRPELENKLEKEVRRERRKTFAGYFSVFLVVAFLLMIYIPVNSKPVFGELIRMNVKQSYTGSYPLLRVKLESGEIIIAKAGKNFLFKKGENVEIQSRRSLLGKSSYRFSSYVQ